MFGRIIVCQLFFCLLDIIFAVKLTAENLPKSYDGKLVIPRPQTIYADSSQYLRERKVFAFTSGFGLIGYFTSIGYFINPDLIIQSSFLKQEDMLVGESILAGAGLTYFLDNSFYCKGELAYRTGDVIDYKNSLVGQRRSLQTTDFGIDLAIGNRWNWSHFAIGGEWFGIYLPWQQNLRQHVEMQFRLLMLHIGIMI